MEPEERSIQNNRRKKTAVIVICIIIVSAISAIYFYTDYRRTHISTDDAFVDGRKHIVASKIPGTVLGVHVQDNELVRKGALLVDLDKKDYTVRVNQAESALNNEKSKLSELETKVDVAKKKLSELLFLVTSARANLKLQEARFRQAELDLKRIENLHSKKIATEEQLEKTKTSNDIAAASCEAALQQVKQSEASVETQHAVIKQTESSYQAQKSKVREKEELLAAEELQRSYTKIYAPADGYITKKTVETGNQIQAGQPVMAVVPLDDVWITANYKETQLEKVKPGLRVKIKVDTYPGKVFQGTVHSIMAGTGSVFSLFPPENATGNYVKVVQRIPVKIVIDEKSITDHIFRIGMSVVPTIIIDN